MADIETKKSIAQQKKDIAEQKLKVGAEIGYMLSNRGNYPEDYSTEQEMTRLNNLYNELSAKEKLLEQDEEDS